MAVTITPLGFKKPDGTEPVNRGDNVISDNADTAETAIQAVRGRLANVESKVVTLVEDPADPGFYIVGGV